MKAVTCTNTKLEVVDQPTLRPAKGQLLIEVLDHGPGTRKTPPVGTPVVAVPLVKPGKDVHAIGLSAVAPGAYAEQLHNLRLPWWHLWRVADKVGAATPKHPVIFECVGVPGIIEGIISSAPLFSRVVVVGVCMGADRFRPSMAIKPARHRHGRPDRSGAVTRLQPCSTMLESVALISGDPER